MRVQSCYGTSPCKGGVQRRACMYEQWHGESLGRASHAVFRTSVRWEVEVVCAGTGAAGTSAAVWAVRTHVSGTSPKLARLWATVSVTPAAHQHINGI